MKLYPKPFLVAAVALSPGAVAVGQTNVSVAPNCAVAAPVVGADLTGLWDFIIDVGGVPNFGLLSLGKIDGGYGGSLTPASTGPVAVRSVAVRGGQVDMRVASGEGDVRFDGHLISAERMCGIVTYHGGYKFQMIAQKRPSNMLRNDVR